MPESGRLSVLPALAVLDCDADVSIIPGPFLRQLEDHSHSVQVWRPLDGGSRKVVLANGPIVTVIHKVVALQLMVHNPLDPVALDPELFSAMPSCDPVLKLGRVTLIKLGLYLGGGVPIFLGGKDSASIRHRETHLLVQSLDGSLDIRVPKCAEEGARESDDDVEQLVPRGSEKFMGPEEALRARNEALDRGVEEAKAHRLPGE